MSRTYRLSLAIAAVLAFAAPLSAQRVPTAAEGIAPFTSAMRVKAPVVTTAAAPAFEMAVEPVAAPVPPAMTRHQSVALMIVGGAGMIVGSLIDGDTGTVIMVGGGVVGLVGLFQYLR